MSYFCKIAWPPYSLVDKEKWPINRTLSFNTIYQIDLFCKEQGKWAEVSYVQAFMALNQGPKSGLQNVSNYQPG